MPLNSISPIDGRYKKYTEPLVKYFSEAASMRYKILMECEYLIALSETSGVGMRKMNIDEKKLVRNMYEDFTPDDAQIISEIELSGYKSIKATNHDFKAIEYFTKEKLKKTSLKDALEWVHFALTSEDASNIAYALMLSESLRDVLIPAINEVLNTIGKLAKSNKNIPMLARTHGQPASPSTFGKEFKIFHSRLNRQFLQLKKYRPQAKLNGATGNYNALVAAYPDINWIKFSEKFILQINKVRGCNLEASFLTTQIESSDSYIELFDIVRRINNILIDFNQDVWRYVSDDWIGQIQKEGEIGSSTMPHKVNPWFLENSEGNLGVANALFEFFGRKLPVSRLQRDLSNSTVLRNIGTAFAHSLIGYKYLINQLGRLRINKQKTSEDLRSHPEVIAEAIQTILRREGVKMPYERLKELTRGKQVSLEDMHVFINTLQINDKVKKELLKITPENYTGLASKLASK